MCIYSFSVDGSIDQLDESVARCVLDEDLAKKHNLLTINSVNWARVMVQTAHFFCAYFQVNP